MNPRHHLTPEHKLVTFALLLGVIVAIQQGAQRTMAAVPECPRTEPLTLTFHGEGLYWNSAPFEFPVTMYPCETFSMSLVVSRGALDPLYPQGVGFTAQAINAATPGIATLTKTDSFLGSSSATITMPAAADGKGVPLEGTRGPNQLVRTIRVTAGSNVRPAYPLTVDGVFTLTPRREDNRPYNTGDLSYDTATPVGGLSRLLVNLPESSSNNKSQYFKVSLAPGASMWVTGSLTNAFANTSTSIVGDMIRASDKSLRGFVIGNQTVPAGSTVAINQTVFTSPANAGYVDYYFVVRNNGTARLRASTIDVNISSPASSKACTCLPTRTTMLPQPWQGIRKVRFGIPGLVTLQGTDREEFERAINDWNTNLAARNIPISFLVDNTPYDPQVPPDFDVLVQVVDIQSVYGKPASTIGLWVPVSNADEGTGTINIDDSLASHNYGDWVWHVALHELGHVMDLDDVLSGGTCTQRDTVMFEFSDVNSPRPGPTCADCKALDDVYN